MPACYAELGIGAVLGERRLSEKRNSPSAIRENEALGLEVTLSRTPDPAPDRPASTPAA